MDFKIDNLQYCNWSRKIFEINREAGLDAIHVTTTASLGDVFVFRYNGAKWIEVGRNQALTLS